MKKLISTLFITLCLFLFAAAVRADDGNGHDAGKCTGTIICPASGAALQQQSGSPGSDDQTVENTTLILLGTLITLLPK